MTKLKKDGTPDMRGRHGNHAKASKAAKWMPGGRPTARGYVRIRVGRSHPLALSGEWTHEHLLVWVSAGNPRPPKGYVIHHRNEDKTDNRIENLEVMESSIHMAKHMRRGNPQAELTWEQVSEIRRLYDSREKSTRELAIIYSVKILVIQRIVSRCTYINGPNGRD